MIDCSPMKSAHFLRWIQALAWLAVFAVPAASAQLRVFPDDSRLATLEIGVAPEVTLNGNPARLAPGSLIRNTQNMIITPNQLAGRAVVVYTRDILGNILMVWVLTEEEFRRERARPRRN